jgi:hypothetical protein
MQERCRGRQHSLDYKEPLAPDARTFMCTVREVVGGKYDWDSQYGSGKTPKHSRLRAMRVNEIRLEQASHAQQLCKSAGI